MAAPTDQTLRWVAGVATPGGRISDAGPLADPTSPWWVRVEADGGSTTVVVRARVDGEDSARLIGIERSALLAAAEVDVAAPRFIAADPDGRSASQPALVSTRLTGSSAVPTVVTADGLQSLGRAVGILATSRAPIDLPSRTRPLGDIDFDSLWRGHLATAPHTDSELWMSVLDVLDAYQPTPVPDTLVHGDCWQGNTVWADIEFQGFIDWDAAGIGPPGIDLGTMRLDAAFFHGADTVDEVAAGWAQTSGRPLRDLGYWDLVAALTSPVDLYHWLPNLQRLGRPDLDTTTLTARREDFVRRALASF
jgi:aminoglycoside phosphotransferase (APT) family kinase protein